MQNVKHRITIVISISCGFFFFTTIGLDLRRRTSVQITPINRHFSSSTGGGGYTHTHRYTLVVLSADDHRHRSSCTSRRNVVFTYRRSIVAATRRGPVYYAYNLLCLLRLNRLLPRFLTTRNQFIKPNI